MISVSSLDQEVRAMANRGLVGTGVVLCALATVIVAGEGAIHAQSPTGQGHLAITDPAELDTRQAAEIYQKLKEEMASGYALADVPIVADYQSWRRHNSAPYLSATHGQRYLNNYVNETGSIYGHMVAGERLPTGTVIAKDSFTMTREGGAFPGALFVMEKLPPGRNPQTGDWRYLVISPDGSLFGDTTGEDPEQVEYCHACHKAKARQDYVFFVPEKYRLTK